MQLLENFHSYANQLGYDFTPNLNGEIQRFSIGGGENLKGWAFSSLVELSSGKQLAIVKFGNWATGEKHEWTSETVASNFSPEELEEIKNKLEESKKAHDKQKRILQREAAELAENLWAGAKEKSVVNNAYLHKKGLSNWEVEGLNRWLGVSSDGKNLIMPIYEDVEQKKITSLQSIYPDGSKKFLPNGKLKGCFGFVLLENPQATGSYLFISEGLATGLSYIQNFPPARSVMLVVALNAGNLPNVAHALTEKILVNSFDKIIVLADNDAANPDNPGFAKGLEALTILQESLGTKNVELEYPCIDSKISLDFNDFYTTYRPTRPDGTPETALQTSPTGKSIHKISWLAQAQTQTQTPQVSTKMVHSSPSQNLQQRSSHSSFELPDLSVFEPMPVRRNKSGKVEPPAQQDIAEKILEQINSNLIRERNDVFQWKGTNWEELDMVEFKHYITRAIQRLRSGLATSRECASVYDLVIPHLPAIPKGGSFFQQVPHLCNFLDGTLEIAGSPDRGYELKFRPHDKMDLLTWALPYEYLAPRGPNPVFEEWLKSCFDGDPDKEGKIRALKQIGGACLVSLYPRVAFLFGGAGTGKSTFAKLCMKFIGPKNYCAVEPHEQNGFLKEAMINKQANIITELAQTRVEQSFWKKVEDRLPEIINRKNRLPVVGFMPALHIYCANDLPKGVDADSQAMNRRVTFVRFVNSFTNGVGAGGQPVAKKYTRDFEEVILAAGSGAVLQFFEEGLRDLLQCGGVYFNPKSGEEILEEWKLENDSVGQFLEECKAGSVGPKGSEIYWSHTASIERKKFYEAYVLWCEENCTRAGNRFNFYKKLRGKSVGEKTINGVRKFSGYGVKGVEKERGV